MSACSEAGMATLVKLETTLAFRSHLGAIVEAFGALLVPSWGSWGPLGGPLGGPLVAILEAIDQKGVLSVPPPPPRALEIASGGPLGALLGRSWALLRPSGSLLGPSCDSLGPSRGHLEASERRPSEAKRREVKHH